MEEDELIKLLRGDPPEDLAEPTDDEIKELLSHPVKVPKEDVERGKARFVRNIVEAHQPDPVRSFDPGMSFGAWVKSVREGLPLSQNMVAAAVSRSTHFIDEVETAKTPLWELDPEAVAALMDIFVVHIQAIESLLRAERHQATRAKRLTRRRSRNYNRGSQRTIMADSDFGQPRYASPAEWLGDLRHHLRRRGADRLLN